MMPPENVIRFFLPDKKITSCTTLQQGKVNDTWLISVDTAEPLILQRLPQAVFSDPEVVMRNISITTDHLQRFFDRQPQNRVRFYTLPARDNDQLLFTDEAGDGWRVISYIPNSRTIEALSSPQQGREIGRVLGLFHTAMATLDPALLTDPLPGLHDTPGYLKTYDAVCSRVSFTTEKEHACSRFIEAMRDIAFLLEAPQGTFCHRIIHGDPKVSNFLFAQNSDEVISLIDLDTVKPGPLLHDLGDCLRSCCNPQGEEHSKPDETVFNQELFHAVLYGYSMTGAELLFRHDIAHLVDAVQLICFELGLRFFTDHLQGDIYFKTGYRGENLQRALIQFHLAQSIEQQRQELQKIVNTSLKQGR